MPVATVTAAVRETTPPVKRDTSIDTAVVAERGASDRIVRALAPRRWATTTVVRMAATPPQRTLSDNAQATRPAEAMWRKVGTASATVAGARNGEIRLPPAA